MNRLKTALTATLFACMASLAADTLPFKPSTDAEENWYYITSYASGDASYCTKSVIYNTKPTANTRLRWGGKSTDENALWKFVDAGDGTYYIVNKANGSYMLARTVSGGTGTVFSMKSKSSGSRFVFTKQKSSATYTFAAVDGNPVFAQNAGGFVATYDNTDAGSAASWYFVKATAEEVAQAEEKTRSDNEDYQLVWSDEFDAGSVPNSADWNFEHGFARNHEAQWYQEDNATVSDGNLVIQARAERRENPNYEAGSSDWKKSREYIDYTSSSITTSGKHSITYGRVEVRAKIPVGSGSWPAIWFLGYGGSGDFHWPHSGEIDLLEYYNSRTWANVCWGGNGSWTASWNSRYTQMDYWNSMNSAWASLYHKWRMDWDSESIKLYLDNELINAVRIDDTYNTYGSAAGKTPFRDNSNYVLLNLAMGGDNGGTIDQSLLPLEYKIDYVRMYQKPGQWYEAYGKWSQTGISEASAEAPCREWLRQVNGGRWTVNAADFSDRAKVQVYDMSGKLLAEQAVAGASVEVPALDTLSSGVYAVRLTDGLRSLSSKVVK